MEEGASRAYLTGLKMLARRELSEAQVRARLSRRHFEAAHIDDAVERLRRERAIDDCRVARACARTEATVRQRGRSRVVRQIESLGIARDVAKTAVNEVFAEIDEGALLERALEKRLRGGTTLQEPAGLRRVHRYLIAQGFDPSRVTDLIRQKSRASFE